MNVRIWSNYIHHTFTHVATAATPMGPLCILSREITPADGTRCCGSA